MLTMFEYCIFVADLLPIFYFKFYKILSIRHRFKKVSLITVELERHNKSFSQVSALGEYFMHFRSKSNSHGRVYIQTIQVHPFENIIIHNFVQAVVTKTERQIFHKDTGKLFMEMCNSWDESNFLVVEYSRLVVLVLFP